jgi:hypothetical protein
MLVVLKLHNNYSYTVVIELHDLHMFIFSHMVSCILCNSFDLSNNIHIRRNALNCDEIQMVIATQKPSCKITCKSPHFLIVWTKLQLIGVMLGAKSLQPHKRLSNIIKLVLTLNLVYNK